MFKGYFYDLYGHEIKTIEPIKLLNDLESSIVEVSLSCGFNVLTISHQNCWALFHVNTTMRLLVTSV